ncbi:short-chain dehydrogenase/reductase [Thelonectria olida]|uniref:Short-chain dehydrogenase/reductase n=1 Tax=Thelonectria olida TaxID=1576542 RepID=A0A9P9AW17_9HYPO|nr:short-chain dehydrogenase/reductase [Thelonectria olida]
MPSPRKSVLITGCSAGGIGAALAEVFHEKGYHVFATARSPSKISGTLSAAANVTVLTLDVLSSESIAAAVQSVEKETDGTLDVLVNNSGGGAIVPALDASIEDGKRLFDLNVWAPLAMLQAFAPLLIKAKGCVVNNSSANAYLAMPLMSLYNSSKAAIAIASETWRAELQPLGVRTVTLVTCAVKTEFFSNYHGAELPEASRYFKIRDFIYGLRDGRLQAGAISSRQYATKVVREVERGTVGTVWAGTNAFLARLTWWLSPQPILVSFPSSRALRGV